MYDIVHILTSSARRFRHLLHCLCLFGSILAKVAKEIGLAFESGLGGMTYPGRGHILVEDLAEDAALGLLI